MRITLLTLLLALACTVIAGEPSPIEDHQFAAEEGIAGSGGSVSYTSMYLRGRDGEAWSSELSQEWGARHRFSYTIPIFRAEQTGLGDVMLNYRFQLLGDEASRVAVAPRLSLILPTRHAQFGERSSGLQINVPLTAALASRVTLHANAGATWFRDRGESEINLAQSLSFALNDRTAISLDAAFTRCFHDSHLLVVRPTVSWTIEAAGMELSPSVGWSMTQDRQGGVLLSLGIARGF